MSVLTNWSRTLKMIAAPIALGALAACATPFNANVERFQSALPAPQGQTFAVVAEDPALAGGLEFAQYADYVENNLNRVGYTQAASPEAADLLVRLDRHRARDGGSRTRGGSRSRAALCRLRHQRRADPSARLMRSC